MKINRTTIYNIQSISVLGSIEGALTGMMFCKRTNLLARDLYNSKVPKDQSIALLRFINLLNIFCP